MPIPIVAGLMSLFGAGGAGAAGAGAAGAGTLGAGLTAGEMAAAGSTLGGAALAPATGASALGTGVGAGAGSAAGMMSALGGPGADPGGAASGALDSLMSQAQPAQMLQPPAQAPQGIQGLWDAPPPTRTAGESASALMKSLGGPKGVVSLAQQLQGPAQPRLQRPGLPMPMPQTATQNPFDIQRGQRRANLGMGQIGRRF